MFCLKLELMGNERYRFASNQIPNSIMLIAALYCYMITELFLENIIGKDIIPAL